MDYYRVIGVAPNASFKEIEAAYWRAAFGASPKRVAELNQAYEVLGNEDLRRTYDAKRTLERPSVERQAEDLARQVASPTKQGDLRVTTRLGWRGDD
ncbi:MAG: DnaJ domain-containing protein [Dehalococcoidia bacterium]